jgi:hypothetical protein
VRENDKTVANFLKKRKISFKLGICKHAKRKPKSKLRYLEDSSFEDLTSIMKNNDENANVSLSYKQKEEETSLARNSSQTFSLNKQNTSPAAPLLLLLSSYSNKSDDGSSTSNVQSMESFLELTSKNNLNAIRDLLEQSKHFSLNASGTEASESQKQNNFKYFDINYRGKLLFLL